MVMAHSNETIPLFQVLDELTPLIREHANETEREKRLSPAVSDALRDAGFFRMLRPASRGGLELEPVSEFRVAEELARIDSAAAWNVQVSNAGELYGGWFSDEASSKIFGLPNAISAGSFNPRRKALAVDGGYRVSGRTPFNSNCSAATWMIGLADVYDGADQRVKESGEPETLLTAIPASDFQIVENWNTIGMRGTGSHDVDVDDVFVPSEFAVPFGPLGEPSPSYDNGLSRMVVWVTAGAHAAVALGVAQAALDELAELGSRVPAYTERALRNKSVVQLRFARAEGVLAAARLFFHSTFDEAWAVVGARGCLDMDEKARCQLAATTAVLTAAEVVDLVHQCVGTAGIREDQGFARHFRDAHVITQHAFLCEARLESVGQIRFGLEPDWGFFQL